MHLLPLIGALLLAPGAAVQAATLAEVLAATTDSDWRVPAAEDTVYLDLDDGRVVIELAPAFAPRHVANLRRLLRQQYFDGLAIVRVQDNYVVQWGDPAAGSAAARSLGSARAKLAPEFDRRFDRLLPWTALPDGDVYAPEVGFANGFPAARDPAAGRIWLAHCYGMVGAGRDEARDSGNGAELYVVIGHAPRHLDRNVTLLGRVLRGIERLSTLPRGGGPLGFYERAEARIPIRRMRLAADLPESEREPIEVLRTDGAAFRAVIDSRRLRRESWFVNPTGRIELCNVPLPVRSARR